MTPVNAPPTTAPDIPPAALAAPVAGAVDTPAVSPPNALAVLDNPVEAVENPPSAAGNAAVEADVAGAAAPPSPSADVAEWYTLEIPLIALLANPPTVLSALDPLVPPPSTALSAPEAPPD